MIRYILVDDEPKILEYVKSKIDTIANDFDLKHIKSYDSSKKAFEEVNMNDFDLLIVDYEMPVYNGIELARKIANNKKVIFLTATTNNAPKMMNALDVSGYMSKPFDIEELQDILKNKVIGKLKPTRNLLKKSRHSVTIGVNKEIFFDPEKVYFISSSLISTGKILMKDKFIKVEKPDGNYVHIYGKNSEVLFRNVRNPIKELESTLSNSGFLKINQSTLVNSNYIKERNNRDLKLYDCKEDFVISPIEKSRFIEKLNQL